MVPSFDGSDDLIWVGGPGEGFRVFVGFGDEAIDGSLEIDEGVEDAALEPPPGEFGEEAFDGVEPRRRCWREVENKPLVAIEPSPDFWMLMGGVVVEDDMDGLSSGTWALITLRKRMNSWWLPYSNQTSLGNR